MTLDRIRVILNATMLILMQVSCGTNIPFFPTHKTESGIWVEGSRRHDAAIEAAFDIMKEEFSDIDLSNVNIIVGDVRCPKETAIGCVLERKFIFVPESNFPVLLCSLLVHEYMHVASWELVGHGDSDHEVWPLFLAHKADKPCRERLPWN